MNWRRISSKYSRLKFEYRTTEQLASSYESDIWRHAWRAASGYVATCHEWELNKANRTAVKFMPHVNNVTNTRWRNVHNAFFIPSLIFSTVECMRCRKTLPKKTLLYKLTIQCNLTINNKTAMCWLWMKQKSVSGQADDRTPTRGYDCKTICRLSWRNARMTI